MGGAGGDKPTGKSGLFGGMKIKGPAGGTKDSKPSAVQS